jgi:hypothetical protein
MRVWMHIVATRVRVSKVNCWLNKGKLDDSKIMFQFLAKNVLFLKPIDSLV